MAAYLQARVVAGLDHRIDLVGDHKDQGRVEDATSRDHLVEAMSYVGEVR